MEDNIIVKIDGVTPGNLTHESIPVVLLEEKPIWIEGLEVLDAASVPEYVLKYAGARPADRDEVDLRLIDEYYKGEGKIIDSQNEVGGYPEVDMVYRRLNECTTDIETWLLPYTLSVMPH